MSVVGRLNVCPVVFTTFHTFKCSGKVPHFDDNSIRWRVIVRAFHVAERAGFGPVDRIDNVDSGTHVNGIGTVISTMAIATDCH